jgi:hypothetical protein
MFKYFEILKYFPLFNAYAKGILYVKNDTMTGKKGPLLSWERRSGKRSLLHGSYEL